MNMMKANRLRTYGKAIRRVAALFITPFLKAHKVGNKYIVVDGEEVEVVPVSEFMNTESKISKWISFQRRQKHVEKLCKDYTIFEVAYYQPQVNELGDPICEKSTKSRLRSSELAPSDNPQDEEWREDYSILQIAY